jgi:hypothetical protein
MKFVEDPVRDPKAGQKSGKNGEPHKYKNSIAGMVVQIPIMSRTRYAEPAKTEETDPTGGTAEDFAAQYEG